jgi:hypothetical protein
VDPKGFQMEQKFNWFNDENRVGVTCGLFEGLNIIIHKESIVQDYLTTVTRLIVFYIPPDPRLVINTFKRQIPTASVVGSFEYFQSSLDKRFNT